MAFTFNQEDDDEAQPKTNIFAPAEGGQAPAGSQQGANAPKTSVSGGGGSSGGGGGSQAPAAQSQAPITPGQRADAYRSLQAKIPTAQVDKTRSQISSADQKLQDQANSYVQGSKEASKGYELSDQDLEGAAQGNKSASERVTKTLSTGAAPVYQAYEGLSEKDRPNVSAYANADTFTDLIRESVGPQYSAGASRLDAMLLKKNPEFRRTQAEIQRGAKALQEKSDKQEDELTKQARAEQEAALKASQESARGRLGTMGQSIIEQAKAKEIEEEARRAKLDAAKIGAEQYGSIADLLREEMKADTPRSLGARSLAGLEGLDPSFLAKYVNIDKDVDWQQLLSEGDVGRYNRISGLLGEGDSLAYDARGAGPDYTFNQGGALADVKGRLQADRIAKDKAAEKAIQDLIAQNQAEAEAATKDRDSRYGWDDFKNYVGPDFDQAAIDELAYRTEHGDQDLARILSQPINTEALSWQDMLSDDEASQLSSLYEDSGQITPENFKAGSGQGARYDVGALKRYYDEILAKRGQKPASPAKGGATMSNRKPTNKER